MLLVPACCIFSGSRRSAHMFLHLGQQKDECRIYQHRRGLLSGAGPLCEDEICAMACLDEGRPGRAKLFQHERGSGRAGMLRD